MRASTVRGRSILYYSMIDVLSRAVMTLDAEALGP